MHTTNTDFINATGGRATTRYGYDVRSLENINLINKRGMVVAQVKNHTTFINPKNADYYKAVTEYADGTAVSLLNTEDYSRVRIRDINGNWHLAQYKTNLFSWNNDHVIYDLICEGTAPSCNVHLESGYCKPKLVQVVADSNFFEELELHRENNSEEAIQKAAKCKGLTKSEAKMVRAKFMSELSTKAEQALARAQQAMKNAEKLLGIIKRIRI